MKRMLALVFGLFAGCVTPPSTAPTPRTAMSVNAPFAKTWNAVIDVFSDRNIPIRTIDRTSGLIATDKLSVPAQQGVKWADCGKNNGEAVPPQLAVYNVLVRGDSTQSTVKVTVAWTSVVTPMGGNAQGVDCVTHGVWESDLENTVRAKAEAGAS
jgi:hypothetical protein